MGEAKRRHPGSGAVKEWVQGSSASIDGLALEVEATRRALNDRQSVSMPATGKVSGTEVEELPSSVGKSLLQAFVAMKRGQGL